MSAVDDKALPHSLLGPVPVGSFEWPSLPVSLDNPWRDAAESVLGAGDAFDAGWRAYCDWHERPLPARDTVEAWAAGWYAAKAADVRRITAGRDTRLDVALAALKRAERGRLGGFCSVCGGCDRKCAKFVFGKSDRQVTVRFAVEHEPGCQLASALYGEWP